MSFYFFLFVATLAGAAHGGGAAAAQQQSPRPPLGLFERGVISGYNPQTQRFTLSLDALLELPGCKHGGADGDDGAAGGNGHGGAGNLIADVGGADADGSHAADAGGYFADPDTLVARNERTVTMDEIRHIPRNRVGTAADPRSKCFDPRSDTAIGAYEDEEEVLTLDASAPGGVRSAPGEIRAWSDVKSFLRNAGMGTTYIGAELQAAFPPIAPLAAVLRVEFGLKLDQLFGDAFAEVPYSRGSGELSLALSLGTSLFSVRAFAVGKIKAVTQSSCAGVGKCLRSVLYYNIGRAVTHALRTFSDGITATIGYVRREGTVLSGLSGAAKALTLRGRVARSFAAATDVARRELMGFLSGSGVFTGSAAARDVKRRESVSPASSSAAAPARSPGLPQFSQERRRAIWRGLYRRLVALDVDRDDRVTDADLRRSYGSEMTQLKFYLGKVCLNIRAGNWIGWAARLTVSAFRNDRKEAPEILACAREFGGTVLSRYEELKDLVRANAYPQPTDGDEDEGGTNADQQQFLYADPHIAVDSVHYFIQGWEQLQSRVRGATLTSATVEQLRRLQQASRRWRVAIDNYLGETYAKGTRVKISQSVRFGVGISVSPPALPIKGSIDYIPVKLGERIVIFPYVDKAPHQGSYRGFEVRGSIELPLAKVELQFEKRYYLDEGYLKYRCGSEHSSVFRIKAKIKVAAPLSVTARSVMMLAHLFLSENAREIFGRVVDAARGIDKGGLSQDTRSNVRVIAATFVEHLFGMSVQGLPLAGTAHLVVVPDVFMCMVPDRGMRVDLRRTKLQVAHVAALGGDALGKVLAGWTTASASGAGIGLTKAEFKGGIGVLLRGTEFLPSIPDFAIMSKEAVEAERRTFEQFRTAPSVAGN
jgi:hypothetical protein